MRSRRLDAGVVVLIADDEGAAVDGGENDAGAVPLPFKGGVAFARGLVELFALVLREFLYRFIP